MKRGRDQTPEEEPLSKRINNLHLDGSARLLNGSSAMLLPHPGHPSIPSQSGHPIPQYPGHLGPPADAMQGQLGDVMVNGLNNNVHTGHGVNSMGCPNLNGLGNGMARQGDLGGMSHELMEGQDGMRNELMVGQAGSVNGMVCPGLNGLGNGITGQGDLGAMSNELMVEQGGMRNELLVGQAGITEDMIARRELPESLSLSYPRLNPTDNNQYFSFNRVLHHLHIERLRRLGKISF